jgi:hypothetical protein
VSARAACLGLLRVLEVGGRLPSAGRFVYHSTPNCSALAEGQGIVRWRRDPVRDRGYVVGERARSRADTVPYLLEHLTLAAGCAERSD